MEKKIDERVGIIRNIIIVALVAIGIKIIYMNVFKYEDYSTKAANKTYKELPIKASRGEIRDRYGELLAGNKNIFTVQVAADGLNKKDTKTDKSVGNDISLKLMNILEANNEKYTDEFPIYKKSGKFYFTYDDNIKNYKKENNIPSDMNAKESFYYIVDREITKGTLETSDRDLDASEIQKKLNDAGIYPPILISGWKFTDQKNKEDWIESYSSKNNIDKNSSAKEVFRALRNYYLIDKSITDTDARKILLVRDLVKSQGFNQYNPVTIAQGIKESTNVQIEESTIELQGVSVETQPIRYYPNGNIASHIIGYMGKMTSQDEEKYIGENKTTSKSYSKGDVVGKTSVEAYFEEKLKGIDGYRKVQVDANGKVTKQLDKKEPESGDTVYLTIIKKLQEVADNALEKAIKTASQTPKGANAKTGALIAVDVHTGDVLAMSSYPDFDPNLFATGISSEDYEALKPKNPNDPLGASALLNLATRGAFQPGSTFKMVTGMTSLENGGNASYTINDPGVIKMKERPFADAGWHTNGGNHGYVNMYKALQVSCNIYFFNLATNGKYLSGEDPNSHLTPNDILNIAKKFGLDEQDTGLKEEMGENTGKVPSLEQKLKNAKTTFQGNLTRLMKTDFTDITKDSNPDEYKKRIQTIVDWADEKDIPTRVEVIKRLTEMKVKEDRVSDIADKVTFDYLKQAQWTDADSFNLAIGQGENQYTPAQMVRYVAAIANGGTLIDLNVVGRTVSSDYSGVDINENTSKEIDFKNKDNLKELVQGMKQVATLGSAKNAFGPNYPIQVAAKSGTAEKSGKIPTADELAFIKGRISSFGMTLSEVQKVANKLMDEQDKENKEARMDELKELLENKDIDDKKRETYEKQLKNEEYTKLNRKDDKTLTRYLRLAIKEINPKITDDQIDAGKSSYSSFVWGVTFAPADDPEIALVCVMPQGVSSGYPFQAIEAVVSEYFGLNDKDDKKSTNSDKQDDTQDGENGDNSSENEESTINFSQQLKK